MVSRYFALFLLLFAYDQLLATEKKIFRWKPVSSIDNFGDALSEAIFRKMIGCNPPKASARESDKVLGLGSILHFAVDHDIIWGTGVNGKHPNFQDYPFRALDVRAVRGPLTRDFLERKGIPCPEIYGDPALLLPRLFPKLSPTPCEDYIIIPHLSEIHLFRNMPHVVQPFQRWETVVNRILGAKFVISSSLHGIIVAEAFGIPARWLKVTDHEPEFKYQDYFYGTGRFHERPARSLKDAMDKGAHELPALELAPLFNAFPHDAFKACKNAGPKDTS